MKHALEETQAFLAQLTRGNIRKSNEETGEEKDGRFREGSNSRELAEIHEAREHSMDESFGLVQRAWNNKRGNVRNDQGVLDCQEEDLSQLDSGNKRNPRDTRRITCEFSWWV